MKAEALDQILTELRQALEQDDLSKSLEIIETLHPPEQAELVSELESDDQLVLLSGLDPSDSADVLEEMDDEDAAAVAGLLPSSQLADILDEMEDDEAADILGDLSSEKAAETLREMDDSTEVIPLLRYPDETAGGLMTRAVITLRPDWSPNDVLEELRRLGPRISNYYYLYVVDPTDRLVGVIGLRELVTAPTDQPISNIMSTDVVSVVVTTDQEECALLLSRYGFLTLPVVDEIGRFVGVITADDLIEVTEDEATEDMYRMVGITGEERTLGSVRTSILKRLPWLAINMLTIFIAISVVDVFEPVIASLVALAVFLPVVSGEGGNAGSQTATVIVRGLALGEVEPRDGRRVLKKELSVGLVNGFLIGIGTAIAVFFWKHDYRISLSIFGAMILNFLMAASMGVLIPLVMKKFKVDPALSSAAFVTAFTDTFGFLFFLGIATLLIR